MATGRGDLERAPRGALARAPRRGRAPGAGARREDGLGVEARQVARPGPPAGPPRRGGLPARAPRVPARAPPRRVSPRDDQSPPSRADRVLGHGERARHRPQRPVEGKLPHRAHAREGRRRHLPGRGQGRERQRQVVLRAGLAEVGGRQVGHDPAGRHGEGLVGEPGADALSRLLHRGVGEPDDGERRKARPQVDLDLDGGGLESEDRRAEHMGDHTGRLAPEMRADRRRGVPPGAPVV